MRRPIAVFATCDDLLAGVCRQIEDYAAEAAIIDATLVQSAAPVPTRKRGKSRKARKVHWATR